MADMPSKRMRESNKASTSCSSAAGSDDSVTTTSVCESSLECQSDTKVSRNNGKRKQATLDRYWSKKREPEAETVHKPTTRQNAMPETVSETLKYESCLSRKEEADCNVVTSEAVSETLKYGSTQDTEATVETLEYDSDSIAASENSTVDDLTDSSPEHLELGISVEEMRASCETLHDLPPLCPSADHTLLFRPDTVDERCTNIPKPDTDNVILEEARWDNDHVRLPHSPQNKLLVNKVVVGRWEKITSSLGAAKWNSSHDIEKAILSYNKYKWDFTELHRYFRTLTEEEHDLFFSQTLPKMAELAVNLPSICTRPIPLLRKQKGTSITMSQQQAASLLANAFFCTFPSRNANCGSDDDIPRLPSINFNSLYRRASAYSSCARHAKLDCLLHYFKRVTTDMPRGTLTFKRQVIHNLITA